MQPCHQISNAFSSNLSSNTSNKVKICSCHLSSHRNIKTEISAKSEDRITWLLRWKPREPRWQSSVRSSGSRLRLGSGTGLVGKVRYWPAWQGVKNCPVSLVSSAQGDIGSCTVGKSWTFIILVEHSLPAKKGSCQPDTKCNQFLMKTSDCQMFSEYSHMVVQCQRFFMTNTS